uniref:Uncharacterized protein n=1 Tax=Caenorhabditis japonica TaxID=281687 RepID=A0A8R1IE58_CAEJA
MSDLQGSAPLCGVISLTVTEVYSKPKRLNDSVIEQYSRCSSTIQTFAEGLLPFDSKFTMLMHGGVAQPSASFSGAHPSHAIRLPTSMVYRRSCDRRRDRSACIHVLPNIYILLAYPFSVLSYPLLDTPIELWL